MTIFVKCQHGDIFSNSFLLRIESSVELSVLLQSFQSVCAVPIVQDLAGITQHNHLSFNDISISTIKMALEDVCVQETDKISREGLNIFCMKKI